MLGDTFPGPNVCLIASSIGLSEEVTYNIGGMPSEAWPTAINDAWSQDGGLLIVELYPKY